MKTTTPGRLLFEDAVPEEFRAQYNDAPIDSDAVQNILQRVADKNDGNLYRDISHALLKLGSKGSFETPSSFSLEDLKSPIDKDSIVRKLQEKEGELFSNAKLTPEQRDAALIKLYGEQSMAFPGMVFDAAMAKGSNLAKMVASGARGNKGQLNSNIGADWLVLDANSNPVPIPLTHSYGEGLSPAEYFASAFGTRRGLISTKFAVADAGFLSKQLAAAAHDMVVTEKDCGTARGIPTTVDDKDNVGAILARPIGGHPAGAIITPRLLHDLKNRKISDIEVRSPLTCQSKSGLCATCAGIRERNHLPHVMDNVGLAATSSLGEPLAQGSLSDKHTAGVASSVARTVSGFQQINALAQIPEIFPSGAAIAQKDGKVNRIEPAPQGGNYLYVGDHQHYLNPSQKPLVKIGDEMEAGDVLSEGIPNPAEIVHHKGIGEGRLYFTHALRQAFKDNGLKADRRNIEIVSRALINHVKVTNPEGHGHALPDDVVEYNSLEHDFEPHVPTEKLHPNKAVGKYLYKPALHYTIGTRVTPRVAKHLEQHGEHEIEVGHEGPGFEPEMQRVMDIPGFKPDWQAQFAGSYLKKRLLDQVHRGDATSDLHGTSFVPGLAYGVEFGHPPKGTVGY